jgi:hypothetical protein
MAFPITDPAKLEADLVKLFTDPRYQSAIGQLLARRNVFKQSDWEWDQKKKAIKDPKHKEQPFEAYAAESLAKAAVQSAFGDADKPCLLDPIFVAPLLPTTTDIRMYRLHDGGSASRSAGTLGGWWCNRRLMQRILSATSGLSGEARRSEVMVFMRSAMFIPKGSNQGKQIAEMRIRPGYCVPAIIGRGSWEALKTDPSLQGKDAEADVMAQGLMPIPGEKQFYLPLFDDGWVTDVTYTIAA